MKVLVKDNREAIEFCGTLQKIMRRIEESNLHDIEKTSFVASLCKIRDTVTVGESMDFSKYQSRLMDYLKRKGVDISLNPACCFNESGHKRGDTNRTLQIFDSSYICHGCGIQGDIYDAVGIFEGIKERTAQYQFIERFFDSSAREEKEGEEK
jgi:hypothetical protein